MKDMGIWTKDDQMKDFKNKSFEALKKIGNNDIFLGALVAGLAHVSCDKDVHLKAKLLNAIESAVEISNK